MKKLFALAALSAVLLATPALADDVSAKSKSSYSEDSNGGYTAKSSTEQTDPAGTTMSKDSEKKVDVDSNGNKATSVDVKTTTDPKGLMNKSVTEIKDKTSEKDGKVEHSHKKSVNGSTVEDSEQKSQ